MSNNRGALVVVSSPSGAGKTTLSRRLLAEFSDIRFSVSYTTRPKRPKETNGIDYWFVTKATFMEMVESSLFAEWALVHGNLYGTSKESVEMALSSGYDVVFDVDWQGGESLSKQWPQESLKVFILPPSLQALEDRLRTRASDSDEVIANRLEKAKEELAHHEEYPHLIVNDDIDEAYAALRKIYLHRKKKQVEAGRIANPNSDGSAIGTEDAFDGGAREHARMLVSEGES